MNAYQFMTESPWLTFFLACIIASAAKWMFSLTFALIHPMLGLIVGFGMFGFGLDLCFRGSDRERRP